MSKGLTVLAIALALVVSPVASPQPLPDAIVFPKCSGVAVTSVQGLPDSGELAVLSALLLENEANMGKVAYCLADAKMTNNKNGLSFGFNQYDLATNSKARGVLASILKVARMADSSLALTQEDIASVESGGLSATAYSMRKTGGPDDVALIGRVNAALSSPAGKSAIDKDYADWLTATVADFDRRSAAFSDAIGAATTLKTDMLARLLLMDYENLFGAVGGGFKGFLAGKSTQLTGGAVQAATPFSFSDLMRFALATKQGAGAARDERSEILRRINNTVKYYVKLKGPVMLGDRDIAYLKGDLKTILADQENPHIKKRLASGGYKALTDLIARAEAI